jgi:hypothetical protein
MGLIVTGLLRLTGVFLPGGGMAWSAFVYYTTQSNVLCLIWMGVMAGVTVRDLVRSGPKGVSAPWPRLGAMVMMAITITMLIYLVILAPSAFVQGSDYRPFTLTDNLVHIITPCLVIADWFLFTPKGKLRLFDPVLWAIPPYLYLVFAFAWPFLGGSFSMGSRYPYPFMDVDVNGVDGVVISLAVLTVALIGFGYLYVGADKLLSRAQRKAAERKAPAGPEPE